jgi:hypothetical protein
LPPGSTSRHAPTNSLELRPDHSAPHSHFLGFCDPQNFLPTHRRIILQSAVSARNKHIALRIGNYEPMQAQPSLHLDQDKISPAQITRNRRPYMHDLAIANRRRHAGPARLKADSTPARQKLPGQFPK